MLKRLVIILLATIVVFLAVILIRTFTKNSLQIAAERVPAPQISERALANLSEAIRIRTISNGDSSAFDSVQFLAFRTFLEEKYPLIHKTMTREIVAGYSLLFKWEGQDKNSNPVILMAHQDVVPIEEETNGMWSGDPFSGNIRDGFIWGRGAADDKINLISIMESVEKLLRENFQPARTIYLAFGHDEELGGDGAIAIVKLLKSRNVRADLVLDEGGILTREKVPGINKPVALLGTAEKGFMSLELKVEKSGGHSAMPEPETAIDILTRGITRLRENQFEADFTPPTQGFIDYIGPEMPFGQRMAFANMWLFQPVVEGIYEKSATGNALIHTTIAPTILQSGMKDNVVPTVARAVINFRMLPGDSSSMVIGRVKRILGDERIRLKSFSWNREATSVTPLDGYAYRKIEKTIKRTADSVITAPFLMIAATDSRHYQEISNGVIKFSPMYDPIGFHGIDERVSLESYQTALWFFEQLIRDLE